MSAPDLSGFGEVQVLERLTGGNRNAVFKVRCGGRLYVAKSSQRSEAAVGWMVRLMETAAAIGLTVPRVQRAASGTYVSGGFTLETHHTGTEFPASGAPLVLELIRQLHTRTTAWTQRPGFASSQDLLSAYLGGDVDLHQMPTDTVDLCRNAWRQLPDQRQAALHGDLGLGNVIAAQDGSPVVIDWDECRLDLPVFDLTPLSSDPRPTETAARLAWEVAACWLREPDYARSRLTELKTPDTR